VSEKTSSFSDGDRKERGVFYSSLKPDILKKTSTNTPLMVIFTIIELLK
jgi:hypothetical protein